jgi:hypothetical protein
MVAICMVVILSGELRGGRTAGVRWGIEPRISST